MLRRILITSIAMLVLGSVVFSDSGLVNVGSPYSVKETADRLESILKEKGMKVVARINHAAGAASVSLKLRPTVLLIFGNPKVGTPLMQGQQTVAIDLPQKMLIWEDGSGKVWLTYNDPEYLAERHGLKGYQENIAKVKNALANFAKAASSK